MGHQQAKFATCKQEDLAGNRSAGTYLRSKTIMHTIHQPYSRAFVQHGNHASRRGNHAAVYPCTYLRSIPCNASKNILQLSRRMELQHRRNRGCMQVCSRALLHRDRQGSSAPPLPSAQAHPGTWCSPEHQPRSMLTPEDMQKNRVVVDSTREIFNGRRTHT